MQLAPATYPFSAKLLLIPWLGYGLSLEAYLAAISAVYALITFANPSSIDWAPATIGLPAYVVGAAFAVKAVCGGLGWFFNVRGIPFSRMLRVVGALVGSAIWGTFIVGFVENGFGPLGTAISVVSLPFAVRVVGMALADYPKPGGCQL